MVVDIAQRDYRETLAKAAEMGGADLILTSPPYDDARSYGADVSWTFDDYRALGDAVAAALKPGGHALVVLGAPVRETEHGDTERNLTPWRVLLDWHDRVGLRAPDWLHYARMGMPAAYTGRFRCDAEPMLWFVRRGGVPYFDKASIADDASSGAYDKVSARSRRNDGSLAWRKASGWAAENGKKHRGTVWNYGNVTRGLGNPFLEETNHPARFHIGLAEDVVACFCPPDGLVCDPFLGSGTSAVAATEAGRSFVGGDLFHDAEGRPWADVAMDIVRRSVLCRGSDDLDDVLDYARLGEERRPKAAAAPRAPRQPEPGFESDEDDLVSEMFSE